MSQSMNDKQTNNSLMYLIYPVSTFTPYQASKCIPGLKIISERKSFLQKISILSQRISLNFTVQSLIINSPDIMRGTQLLIRGVSRIQNSLSFRLIRNDMSSSGLLSVMTFHFLIKSSLLLHIE